ncbi:response regulator [Pseudonocardia sp. TRM90224]|uniref:response regulator n=1 Tax=Pseudonocardia sp. TRM90224 TaxID=2812678 RepID=UPI001E46FF72|nr:response regulator [Pseudonocardia sp. TRM90224]
MIRTLVVEDDPVAAAAHAAYVGRVPGFEVVATAMNGADALRAVTTTQIDLVLLDVHLPDTSGLEVLRRMRAAGHTTDVIMVTRARDLAVVHAAISFGATQYLVKPFTFSSVRAKLAGYLEYRERLRNEALVAQGDVDELFSSLRGRVVASGLPKGVTKESLDAVSAALQAAGRDVGLTAAEVAGTLGASRVTARRYLEYLVETGLGVRRARYGGTGRPQTEYLWREGGVR